MATTWIVSADTARARVLQVADQTHELVEIEDLLDPGNVGDYLERARAQCRYDKVYLIAPPDLLGSLRRQLGKEVEKLVCEELDKDLFRLNARQLEQYFSSRR
jgi:protein required for attachment to host cells